MNKVDLGGYLYPATLEDCTKPTNLHEFRRNLYHVIQFPTSTSLGEECEVIESRGKLYQPSNGIAVIATRIDRVFQEILVNVRMLPESEQFEQLIKFRSAVLLYDKLLASYSCHPVDEKMENTLFLSSTLDKIDHVLQSLTFFKDQVENVTKLALEFSSASPSDKVRIGRTIQTILSVIHFQESFFQAIKEENLLAFLDSYETNMSKLIPFTVVGNITFAHMTEMDNPKFQSALQDPNFKAEKVKLYADGFQMEEGKKTRLARELTSFFGTNIDLPTRLLLASSYYYDEIAGLLMSPGNLSTRQLKEIVSILRQVLEKKDCDKRENIEKLLVVLLKEVCEKKSNASFLKTFKIGSAALKHSSFISSMLSNVGSGPVFEMASLTKLKEVADEAKNFIADAIRDYQVGRIPKKCTSYMEFPYRFLEQESIQRYHFFRPYFMEMYKKLHQSLLDLQGLSTKQKLSIYPIQKMLPLELERLPDASFFLSEAPIFPSESAISDEERSLGFLPPQPLQGPHLPKRKKDRTFRLPEEESIGSSSKESQLGPVASSASSTTRKKTRPVPPVSEKEAIKINYTDWVQLWLTNPDVILKTQGYKDLSPESQRRATMAHAFSTEVDSYIYSHGIHSQWKDVKRGSMDDHYSIPGEVDVEGKTFTGVFTYCFNSKGVCYHRHFKQKDIDELLMEYITKRKWEIERDIEYPTLEASLSKQKAALKTGGDERFTIVEISPLVTELTFPDSHTVIRIFNIN